MLSTTTETHGGRRLRVARLGTGPPFVLLHGYPDNLQIFSELAPRLAERCEVIAFDWPGMGWSETWPGGTTLFHMADRLLALVDAWGLDRVGLLGMDIGGQPALAFAAAHPGRVSRLVVMNSLVMPDHETSWEIRVLRRSRWNERLIGSLPRLVFVRAERTSLPRGVRLPPDLRRDLWESFRRKDVRTFVSRMCGGYQGSLNRLSEQFARIRCPTLVLWGEKDRHFPPVHGRSLSDAIAASRLEIVPGGEHWMAFHLAGEVARRIEG